MKNKDVVDAVDVGDSEALGNIVTANIGDPVLEAVFVAVLDCVAVFEAVVVAVLEAVFVAVFEAVLDAVDVVDSVLVAVAVDVDVFDTVVVDVDVPVELRLAGGALVGLTDAASFPTVISIPHASGRVRVAV
jgi:hypothetical protein